MPESANFDQIIELLETLTGNEGEYFSHQTALFLLGLQAEPPAILTIVADRRRRNRLLGSFELTFVYHGDEDSASTQIIAFKGKRLRVSTIEKTLVDLTKDCAYAPPFPVVADLFCRVSYNIRTLLNIARQTSDSVLKRVSLYLAWSGRAAYHELPVKLFKRTPVKLDSGIEDDLLWNGLFNCRFPAALLQLPPSLPPTDVDLETRLWMELRRLDEFCVKQAASGMIFVRESPEPRIKAIIENYFIEIFKNLSSEKLEWLLANGINSIEKADFPAMIPRLLVTFVSSRTDVLNLRLEEIIAWVLQNLTSSDLGRVDSAIYFGILAGLEDEVVRKFEQISSALFYAGRFSTINFFANHFLHRGIKLAHSVYIDISKTFSAQDRCDESLQLLEEAKLQYEDSSAGALGQLYYATALVLKRLNRDDESLAELFLARETFLIENNLESLARTENSLGNTYFSRGHPKSARAHYHAGLHLARQGNFRTLLPSFLANLGLVEYDAGNFTKARMLLTRAYNFHKMQNNHWNASVTGMGLGKLFLKLGQFFKAMKIFREVLIMREEKKNLSGMYEIYSLLSWICEVLGKTAAARTYANNAELLAQNNKLELRACYVGESLLAMTHAFNNRLQETEKLYIKMYNEAIRRKAEGVQAGVCQYGLAMALIFQGRTAEATDLLAAARKNFGVGEDRIQLIQVNLIASLYFPEKFPDLNLSEQIDSFLSSGSFDPFWGHIAAKLYSCRDNGGSKFLRFHISHTPPTMLNQLIMRFSGLAEIVTTLQGGNNRAGEFFTMLSQHETRTLHQDEYLEWQKKLPANHLIFDATAGQLSYSSNTAKIKAGSIPHTILLQLFIAQPHSVEIDSLYKSAWGTVYDPDFDNGAFKSTVQRLKHLLKSLSPSTRIVSQKTPSEKPGIKLSMATPWILVFK